MMAMGWTREITRYQWLVLLVAWFGWVFDIMDTALFNFAKVPMLTELLGAETYKAQGAIIEGRLLTVFLIGWSLGGVIFGVLADRWGRTRTMAVTILLYSLFTGLTIFCQTWEQVAVVRFVTALGIGGEWAAGAALIAEVFPDKARAPAAGFLQSAAAFGPVFAAIANLGISAENWRWLFLIGVAPALVVVIIRLYIREPARSASTPSEKPPLADLFSNSTFRRNALIALVIGVVGIAGAQNISYWLPNLVKSVSEGFDANVVQQRMSYVTMVMHIGTLLGVLFAPWLCAQIGRRLTLLIFFVASPLSVIAATYGGGTYSSLLLLAPLMSFFTIGVSGAFVLYFPELFASRVRATGIGIAYNVSRIVAAGVPILTASIMAGSTGGTAEGIWRTSIVLAVGILVLPLAPETKGKPLPE